MSKTILTNGQILENTGHSHTVANPKWTSLVLSKSERGTTMGVYELRLISELSFALGKYATVLQSDENENLLRGYVNQYISICTNSQAALHALAALVTTSKLVLKCQRSLDVLSQRNWVILVWVPGHSGVRGLTTWPDVRANGIICSTVHKQSSS